MSRISLNKNLEQRIFSRVCLIMAAVALLSFILDILFTPFPLFLIVDVAVFLVLGGFYYLVNHKLSLQSLVYPFIVFMIVMINLSWSVSGQGIAVGYIYFFIFIIFLIITEGKQRKWIAGLVIINVIGLTIIQSINPDFGSYSVPNSSDENLSTGIGFACLLGLTAYVIGYLKRSYEEERNKVNQKNFELSEKNHEIEAQNEMMRQYYDKILLQKDKIEKQMIRLREANEHIQEVNIDLEKIVQTRTSELNELFYRTSHDFRQPLTTLMGLSYLAKVSIKDDYTLELFNKIDSTTCKMDRMLSKFLMTYEINHYHNEQHGRYSFGEIIEDIRSELIKGQDFINLKVTKQVENYSLNDPRNFLLKFVLYNLIDNSIRFRRDNKVSIVVDLKEHQGIIKLTVSDDGLGIPRHQQHRIFDMFIRTNEASEGSGMGLYVVKKAVDKLRGNIVCQSEEGEYSKFEICFPLHGEEHGASRENQTIAFGFLKA
ncbi:MAG: HAMP domain-containing sensor histidine kinase [Bacteroidota bacterium]